MACPTCGGDGEFYAGPAQAAVSFFLARAIWALHRLRQSLDLLGRADRADFIGCLIRDLESITEDTHPGHDS